MASRVDITGCAERWNRIGLAESAAWREATEALIAAAGLVTPDGQGLCWLEEPCALAAEWSPEHRAGIRIGAFTLVVFDRQEQLRKTMPLGGASTEEVAAWTARQGIARNDAQQLDRPLPTPDASALVSLERSISNTHAALATIAHSTEGATQVRTDPATLQTTMKVRLATRSGEPERVIVVGFAPSGDQGEFFVRALPEDAGSEWTLSMRSVVEQSDGDAQAKSVEGFLQNALQEAYAQLHREWRRRPSGRP